MREPVRRALLVLLSLCAASAFAQELKVTGIEQYTENRGWNEAGIGPHFQMIVVARVSPSGYPTLVYAEQDGVRHGARPQSAGTLSGGSFCLVVAATLAVGRCVQ